MKRLSRNCAVALPLALVFAMQANGDVKTRERNSFHLEGMAGRVIGMFAGKAAKEGVESMMAVKGDRKATINESTGRIVDLGEEKVYELDMHKKTYTVKTFDDIRREMREAEERAKKNAAEEPGAEKQEPQEAQKPQKEYEVDFDAKDTGQKKTVAGYGAHEVIATITVREKGKALEDGGGMVMTNDMWLGPEIPQMKESADFEMRYWQKLQGGEAMGMTPDQMATVMAMYPLFKNAMDRFQKEGVKMQGTALETTSTVDAVKSKEEMEQEAKQSADSGGASGGLGGMLARRMAKRANKDQAKQRATVITLHHEILEVSTSVAPSDLQIPAGFQEKK